MIIDKEKFGTFLAQARVESGIAQLDLARRLGYSSPQYVSNWERGICGPPMDKLFDICKILKIDSAVVLKMIMKETEDYLRNELRLGSKKK